MLCLDCGTELLGVGLLELFAFHLAAGTVVCDASCHGVLELVVSDSSLILNLDMYWQRVLRP